jgi:hypothetical protein
MYLESVALFPQLYMFQKQATDEGGIVEVDWHLPLPLPKRFNCFFLESHEPHGLRFGILSCLRICFLDDLI